MLRKTGREASYLQVSFGLTVDSRAGSVGDIADDPLQGSSHQTLETGFYFSRPLTSTENDFMFLLKRFYTALLGGCFIYKNDYLVFQEIEMSKKLIFALALSLVLVSGGLFSAQAGCGCNPCGWHWFSCYSCGARDMDRPDAAFSNYPMSYGTYDSSPWPPGQ